MANASLSRPQTEHQPMTPGQSLPPLGDLAYRAQRFLLTDSKMSEILVVHDERGREFILKIACVRQRSRMAANRHAIHNAVTWLQIAGDHPGIITLHPIQFKRNANGDSKEDHPSPIYSATLREAPEAPEFIVLDYIHGGTLGNFVRKRPLPYNVTLWLAHRLAETLAHLHAHGCVHRDLKPENILFPTRPREATTLSAIQPVLIDFGVAAGIGESKFASGSRLWMAPELQAAYERTLLTVDPSWDIYALGLICCYMLSGLRPRRRAYTCQDYLDYRSLAFTARDAVLAEKQSPTPPTLAPFKELICATLAESPAERPSAASFAAEIGRLLAEMDIAVTKVKRIRGDNAQRAISAKHAVAVKRPQRVRPSQPVATAQSASLPTTSSPAQRQLRATETRLWRYLNANRYAIGVIVVLSALLLFLVLVGRIGGGNSNAIALEKDRTDGGQSGTQVAIGQITEPTLIGTHEPTAVSEIPTLAQVVDDVPITVPTVVGFPTKMIPTLASLPLALPNITNALPATPLELRLVAPLPDAVGSAALVTFRWQHVDRAATAIECYELVFWDPQNSNDKRALAEIGREPQRTVDLDALAVGEDPLLRRLTQRNGSLIWGVRVIHCDAPQIILQDVGDGRRYDRR